MYYIDENNEVYDEKPEDIKTSEVMTIKEACVKWGVEGSWARRIVSKVPGAKQLIINGRNTWVLPADAQKPTKNINRK